MTEVKDIFQNLSLQQGLRQWCEAMEKFSDIGWRLWSTQLPWSRVLTKSGDKLRLLSWRRWRLLQKSYTGGNRILRWLDLTIFLDYLMSMNDYLVQYVRGDECSFRNCQVKGTARLSWEILDEWLAWIGCPQIETWGEMKFKLKEHSLLADMCKLSIWRSTWGKTIKLLSIILKNSWRWPSTTKFSRRKSRRQLDIMEDYAWKYKGRWPILVLGLLTKATN